MDDAQLELREAARALGVHYQTAYRWVRSGELPAQVVGKQYVVSQRDVDELKKRRAAPAPPRKPTAKRVAQQAKRVHVALLDGDESSVRQIARSLVTDGTGVVELIQSVIAPPLRQIGEAWHRGELDIWVEHRASAIVERTLGDLVPNPRGRRRGTAMVASISGDLHSLPTTMAAIALREANWNVEHLGADMPEEELVRFCTAHDVDLAVISVTNLEVAQRADALASRLQAAGTPTLVGGTGSSLEQLVTVANGGEYSNDEPATSSGSDGSSLAY